MALSTWLIFDKYKSIIIYPLTFGEQKMKSIDEKIERLFAPYTIGKNMDWRKFASIGEVKFYSKGEVIKWANATEKRISLILSGSASIHLWNKNNYKCIDLVYEYDFLVDYLSFTTQRPTPIETVLMEDSELFIISYDAFKKMLEESPYGKSIAIMVSNQAFIAKQEQQINLLTKTALERLVELKSQVPNLLERTPKKYIASYLGITPQSLSRIIKK